MLTIQRPTPTTVLYTVSSRPSNPTITARAKILLALLLRIVAGILVFALLLHEYLTLPSQDPTVRQSIFEQLLVTSPFGHFAALLAAHSTRIWRLVISSGIVWLVFRRSYISESLLVIRGLGVQTSKSSPSYLWSSTTRFIPTSSIQDIFIHEAFKGFEVRFYLSIVVEGEETVVVIFPNLLPRREVLEEVWRGSKACLYEPKA